MSAEQNSIVNSTLQMPDTTRDSVSSARTASTSSRLKRPVKMKRNTFGVSDPSLAKPESSQVAAEGRIQPPGSKKSVSAQSVSEMPNPDYVEEEPLPLGADTEAKTIYNPPDGVPYATDTTANVPDESQLQQQQEAIEAPRRSLPMAFSLVEEPTDILPASMAPASRLSSTVMQPPEIEILSPSNPTSVFQTPLIEPAEVRSNSSVVLPSAPLNTPAPPEILSGVEEPLPRAQSLAQAAVVAPSVPVSTDVPRTATTNLPPLTATLSTPNSTLSKTSRGQKIIKKIRKMLLRRGLLNILLGKELGGTAHAQLQQAGSVPKPVTALMIV